MLVVGVDLFVAHAHFYQLLEVVAQGQICAIQLARALDRFRERKKLGCVLGDIERIGDDEFDDAARDFGNLRFPFEVERVARSDS